MSTNDPSDRTDPTEPSEPDPTTAPEPTEPTASSDTQPTTDESAAADKKPSKGRARILIGSQRDPAAYRARRTRDWEPVADEAPSDRPAEQPSHDLQPS